MFWSIVCEPDSRVIVFKLNWIIYEGRGSFVTIILMLCLLHIFLLHKKGAAKWKINMQKIVIGGGLSRISLFQTPWAER